MNLGASGCGGGGSNSKRKKTEMNGEMGGTLKF